MDDLTRDAAASVDASEEVVDTSGWLSAGDAAARVGVSRQTIVRAIRAGKIDALPTPSGGWQVDPVSLNTWKPQPSPDTTLAAPAPTPSQPNPRKETSHLEAELARVRAQRDALARALTELTRTFTD